MVKETRLIQQVEQADIIIAGNIFELTAIEQVEFIEKASRKYGSGLTQLLADESLKTSVEKTNEAFDQHEYYCPWAKRVIKGQLVTLLFQRKGSIMSAFNLLEWTKIGLRNNSLQAISSEGKAILTSMFTDFQEGKISADELDDKVKNSVESGQARPFESTDVKHAESIFVEVKRNLENNLGRITGIVVEEVKPTRSGNYITLNTMQDEVRIPETSVMGVGLISTDRRVLERDSDEVYIGKQLWVWDKDNQKWVKGSVDDYMMNFVMINLDEPIRENADEAILERERYSWRCLVDDDMKLISLNIAGNNWGDKPIENPYASEAIVPGQVLETEKGLMLVHHANKDEILLIDSDGEFHMLGKGKFTFERVLEKDVMQGQPFSASKLSDFGESFKKGARVLVEKNGELLVYRVFSGIQKDGQDYVVLEGMPQLRGSLPSINSPKSGEYIKIVHPADIQDSIYGLPEDGKFSELVDQAQRNGSVKAKLVIKDPKTGKSITINNFWDMSTWPCGLFWEQNNEMNFIKAEDVIKVIDIDTSLNLDWM
mgnify:CR=1 FL=1|jgi:hypothetical protein